MASLPPALNIKPLPSVEAMEVKTNTLEPITLTDTQAVFALPSEGILDQNSVLKLTAVAIRRVPWGWFEGGTTSAVGC